MRPLFASVYRSLLYDVLCVFYVLLLHTYYDNNNNNDNLTTLELKTFSFV